MQFHLKSNKGEESIARLFSCRGFHGSDSASGFIVASFYVVGGSKRAPFFFGEMKERETGSQAFFQAIDRRGQILFPLRFELNEKVSGLCFGGGVEDQAYPVSHRLFELLCTLAGTFLAACTWGSPAPRLWGLLSAKLSQDRAVHPWTPE